jgi:organic radical activating enzyme
MKYLTLFLTEKCTRSCAYCDIPTIKKKKSLDLVLLRSYYDLINDSSFSKIVLTGGEPGTLSEDILSEIFNEIRIPISVNTNGEFIKRGYFKKFYDKFVDVQYHPVTEINKRINLFSLDQKIRYHIPVHKDNIILLPQFLDNYKIVDFEIAPYDSKNGDISRVLDISDFKLIYYIIKDRNVTNQTKINFRRLSKLDNIDSFRKACINKFHFFPSIDFVNSRIKKCICSHTRSSSIELNISNFNKLNNGELKFEKSNLCDYCCMVIEKFDEILKDVKK